MGNIASKTTADGAERSTMAQILDPVGACIQPTNLSTWKESTSSLGIHVPAARDDTPAPAPVEVIESAA